MTATGTFGLRGLVVTALLVLLAVLGLPTMHLRGVFLAIATLGFAEAVRVVLLNQEWTGGAQGLAVPRIHSHPPAVPPPPAPSRGLIDPA